MKLQEIYELGIEMGSNADPRGVAAVKKVLVRHKKEYEELTEKKKALFDTEMLTNPYSDSRIMYGDPQTEVKKILAGIDADAPEILLADRLNQKGMAIDLVITHHPTGHALASLHDVMDLQIDVYGNVGIPVNVAQALMEERMSLVKRRIDPLNHNQSVDVARLLGMPLLGLHTIWDNLGDKYMRDYLAKREYDTVGDVYDYICEIPEFVESTRGKAGPAIVSGSAKSRAGKVVIFFTGGTNPAKEMYIELAKVGVGTIIDMHMPEETLIEMKKLHVNVINTGHMASDSIGANLFFDELAKHGVEVIAGAGFIRAKRTA